VWIRSLLDRNAGARLARERLENRNYAAGPVAAWPNVLERVGQFPTLVYRFLRRANARPWRSTSLPRRRRNELPTGSGDRLLSEKERGGSYSSLVGFVSIRSSPQFTLPSLIRGVAEFQKPVPDWRRPTGKCIKEDLAPLQDLNKDSVIVIIKC
jgi:hypothetical protein